VKHYKNKKSLKSRVNLLKICFFIFLIYGVILLVINILINNIRFSNLIFIGNILNYFKFYTALIFTILFFCIAILIVDYFRTKKNTSKYLKKIELIIVLLGITISITEMIIGLGIIPSEIQIIVINSMLIIGMWILKIIVFFGIWSIIIIYILIKNYLIAGNLKYKVINHKIIGQAVVLSSKKGYYRIISILEVSNIPKNIQVRENRLLMKNIEKIFVNNNQHYLHYHLTALFNYLEEVSFSYEITIESNKVHLRLFFTMEGKNLEELLKDLRSKIDIIIEIYKTSFPELKFTILDGDALRKAWSDVIGGIGKFNIKINEEDILEINQKEKKLYLQIIKLIGKPEIKAYSKRTQIDNLIMSILGSNISNGSFIINFQPFELYKFKNGENNPFYDLTNIPENDFRQKILKIRHVEITALWRVSAYFIIRSYNFEEIQRSSKKIIAIIDSIFSGNQHSIDLEIVKKNLLYYILPKLIIRDKLGKDSILTSERLATYLHLPEEPFPSINRTNIPNFEIPPKDIVEQKLVIGTALFRDKTDLFQVGLDVMDLRLNMFVTGLIGMGKTTFVKNILKNISKFYPEINWICLDWKGDYVELIKNKDNIPILVLRPGSIEAPFQINMFDPYDSNEEEHARKLFSIIVELFKSDFQNKTELSIQMEKVCREVIKEVVCDPSKRSLKAFFEELKIYLRNNSTKNPTIRMTINSLENRFDRFRSGNLKKIFYVDKTNFKFQSLMDKKVIFDFNYLLSNGGTKQDVRFLMNLILKFIFDNALRRGLTQELKHIIVIEDSQLLLPAILREVAETNLGEDIPLLLRGVGQSMITIATRPEISPDIISNSGIKVSFRSTYDAKKIANYQNLNKEQEEYLKIMPKREAIITIPSFSYPFRIRTIDSYFDHVSKKEIYENNKFHFPFIYKNTNDLDMDGSSIQRSSKNYIEISNSTQNNNEQPNNPTKRGKSIVYLDRNNYIIKNNEQNLSHNEIQNQIFEDNDFNLQDWEKIYWKNLSSKGKYFYLKLRDILIRNPLNKYQIIAKLNINLEEFELEIEELIENGIISSKLVPVFEKNKLQKWYCLNDGTDYLLNAVKNLIEREFVQPGIFGYAEKGSLFDYIWFTENILIKLYVQEYNMINQDNFRKQFTDLMMESCEKEINQFIIITGFISDKIKIKNWLNKWNYNEIFVFSFNNNDWNELEKLIENGLNHNLQFLTYNSQSKNNIGQDSMHFNSFIDNKKMNDTINFNKRSLEKLDDYQIIEEIKQDFSDYYPDVLLEKFGTDFPKVEEISDYLGCNISLVEKKIAPIKNLKSYKIYNLDNNNLYDIYYGWANRISGKKILKKNIIEQLSNNDISFRTDNKAFDIEINYDIFLPNFSIIINLIFEENEIEQLRTDLSIQEVQLSNVNIVIICYDIELKELIKRKLKNWNLKFEPEILRYDWSEIKPWIRRLRKKL